ncbi:MAG: hypothetical protein JWM32_2202 [Verrucomicrobia bacterium]|nr:hypothetical protein [Verrucomicrobiota bacterium]
MKTSSRFPGREKSSLAGVIGEPPNGPEWTRTRGSIFGAGGPPALFSGERRALRCLRDLLIKFRIHPLGFAGVAALFLAQLTAAKAASVTFKLADGKDQPVADAVVSLIPLDVPAKVVPPAAPLEIVQRGEEFSPYVTALVVGTSVSFPNRDTVQHHVYSLSKPKKFELPLYAGEAKAPVLFDQPGIVALGCNIHDWMAAYVVVLATPWFGRTAADGTATVAEVPPGRYRAEVWHPRLAKTQSREVTVTADAAAAPLAFSLALKADRRLHRSNAKSGLYN